MVELVQEVPDLPMRGWVCGNCGEPYNSKRKPDQNMCLACREETIWQLPEAVEEELRETLRDACEGDRITVVPERAAAMYGTVTAVDGDEIVLDGDGDARTIRIDELALYRESDQFGDDLHHVIVTPEEDIVEDPRVTKRVKTPGDEVVHGAATHVGLDPDTVEVQDVRWVDGELEFELRGEA